jgi:hypothetical protein
MKVFSSLLGGFSNINQGTVTNGVEFYGNTFNNTNNVASPTFTGTAKFFNGSYNNPSGVLGTAIFNATSTNQGAVTTGTFNNSSSNQGTVTTGTFNASSTNAVGGTVTNATFNNSSVNLGTLVNAIFNGTSYNNATTTGNATFAAGTRNSGTVGGNATFATSTRNEGIVLGTATFSGNSYNVGTTTNATFVGDLAENFFSSVNGVISSVATRMYTSVAPQINQLRSFIDRAWSVVADNTLVKLLFRDRLGIVGLNSNPVTTFVEQNDGAILRPLVPGIITSCGVLDTENGTYIIATSTDITNWKYDTCFIVRANGVTLDGNNKTISGLNTSSAVYAILATSTPSVDGTSNAFTNLTVKNIRFQKFAYALNISGTASTTGSGGNAGTVSFATSTLGAGILSNGANGLANGGNGGLVNFTNTSAIGTTASTTISANGGNSTSCGNGGGAGTVNTIDSGYDNVSITAGTGSTAGCPGNPNAGSSGSSGQQTGGASTGATDPVQSSINNAASQAAAAAAAAAAASASTNNGGAGSLNGIFNPNLNPLEFSPTQTFTPFGTSFAENFVPQNTGVTVIPYPFQGFAVQSPLQFIPAPNLNLNISAFLFAPLPQTISDALSRIPQIANALSSAGINTEQSLASLATKPVELSNTDIDSGQFIIKSGETILTTYATYDSNTGLSQLVKVSPNQSLNISLIPLSTGEVTATYLDQTLTFNTSDEFASTNITTPQNGGRYILRTSSSPIPLLIEVVGEVVEQAPEAKPWGIFNFVWEWFN